MSRVDVMVDIETLGTKADSTIIQISAIAFDIKTGDHLSKFDAIADIEKNEEMKVDGSTIKWWLNTDKQLLGELISKGEKSSNAILMNFYGWLHTLTMDMNDVYLWGNGILFDNKMIQHQLEALGQEYPIFYKNDRDVRTIVDLAGAFLGVDEKYLKGMIYSDDLVAHNAIDDCAYQVRLVAGCYRMLTKGVQ